MDLQSFAKTTSRHCPLCEFPKPLLKEIKEGWDAGVRAAAIVLWLKREKKIEVTAHKVRAHIEHQERRDAKNA